MEKKMKILAFAAVALMFAVCFIGFVAINDGEVDAEDTATTCVAKIGNEKYSTLEAAWNAAVSANSDVVIDVFSNSKGNCLQIKDRSTFNKSVTLNLNGYKYEFTSGAVGSTGTVTQALHLNGGNGCKVIIKDGTLIVGSDGYNSGIKSFCMNYVDLELNNVVVDLSGTDCIGIRSCEDTLTITGNTEFKMDSKKEAITNDMFGGHTSSNIVFDENFTGTIYGDIYVWNEGNADIGSKGTIQIKSGTFLGKIGKAHGSEGTSNAHKDDGTITVSVSGGSFTDIANAVKYATSGATITLADDVEILDVILVNKK